MSARWRARSTKARRPRTPILSPRLSTWRRTVNGEITKVSAISRSVSRSASNSKTSASRSVSGSRKPSRWLGGRRTGAARRRRKRSEQVDQIIRRPLLRNHAGFRQARQQAAKRRAEIDKGTQQAARLRQFDRILQHAQGTLLIIQSFQRQRLYRQRLDKTQRAGDCGASRCSRCAKSSACCAPSRVFSASRTRRVSRQLFHPPARGRG